MGPPSVGSLRVDFFAALRAAGGGSVGWLRVGISPRTAPGGRSFGARAAYVLEAGSAEKEAGG